jgi:hypothetical protein
VLGAGGNADGLVAILRGGVVAWVRGQTSVLHTSKAAPEMAEHREARVDPERTELVRIFANIISQHLSEEAA